MRNCSACILRFALQYAISYCRKSTTRRRTAPFERRWDTDHITVSTASRSGGPGSRPRYGRIRRYENGVVLTVAPAVDRESGEHGGEAVTLLEIFPSLRSGMMSPRLDATVWPCETHYDDLGRITVGGVALADIADQYGTPTYVLDETEV